MINKPVVSIIVPIYNVEQYLFECLQSIRNQTFTNFEVILIDDGSTDSGQKICYEFSNTDPRFKVIVQNNAGLSASRNVGLKKAIGEFILFVDSDDVLNEHLLASTIGMIKKYKVDAVSFNFNILENGEVYSTNYGGSGLKLLDSLSAMEHLLSGSFGNYAWKMLVRKKIYDDNKIFFPENRQFEDVATTYKIIGAIRKIYFTDQYLYLYRKRHGSITKVHSDKDLDDMLITFTEIETYMNEKYPDLMKNLGKFEFNLIFMLIIRMAGWDVENAKAFQRMSKDQKKYLIRSKRILKQINLKFKQNTMNFKKQQLKLFLLNLGIFPIMYQFKAYWEKRNTHV